MARLLTALALSTALAGLAAWRHALTRGGLLLAWCLALVITWCSGAAGFAVLAAVFLFTVAAGKCSRRVREPIEGRLHAKTGARDAVQIICNVLTGAAALLCFACTGREPFLWAYGGAMAASLADSMASELGVLSRMPPRDICTLRPAEKGISGAVSPLGLSCSAVGAAIIAGIAAPLFGRGLRMFWQVTLAGFLAALLDSVLGSAVQAKYRCPVCGALTEKPRHCARPGTLVRGLRWMTNDTVNLCNNLAGALLAAAGCALL